MGHPTDERQEVLDACQAVFLDTSRRCVHGRPRPGSHGAYSGTRPPAGAVGAAANAADTYDFSRPGDRWARAGGRWSSNQMRPGTRTGRASTFGFAIIKTTVVHVTSKEKKKPRMTCIRHASKLVPTSLYSPPLKPDRMCQPQYSEQQ